jgi:hypothetical protein
VIGVHAETGLAPCHGVDEYTSGFADKGQRAKDNKHSRYDHNNTAHGLAFCSVGSLAEGAAEAVNSGGKKLGLRTLPNRTQESFTGQIVMHPSTTQNIGLRVRRLSLRNQGRVHYE